MSNDTEGDLYFDSLEEEWSMNEANNLCRLYLAEGNGLQVWRALRELHEAKIPIPESIIKKFVEWSIALEGANTPIEACKALELGGGAKDKKGLQRAKQIERHWRLAGRVTDLMRLYKIGSQKAIELVSRDTGKSVSMVKKVYYSVTSTKPKRKANLRKNQSSTSTLDSVMHGVFGR
jgi:hypothetical protein